METLRVLVVDDELGMRHSITRALKTFRVSLPDVEGETSFEIDQAESVAEGLAKIRACPPDILLLDYKLQDGTGLDVLDGIKEFSDRILTVMVTAYATLETAVRATKQGAHDFLAKPFTPTELKDTVRRTSEHLIVQRQARRLAEERRKIRFQFIRVLGHELKAPLAAVEGFLRLLSDRCLGDDIAAYDEIVSRCLARAEGMRKLISDLLDLTRIESGERRRELVELDLVPIIDGSIEMVSTAAADRGIRVARESDAAVLLQGDRVELEIVLNNLLSNAVKYNRDGGAVTVRVRTDDDTATVDVIDTGIGMTPDDCAKLFQDFVRIKNEKTRMITGSGLGLSTIKKIAQLYNGDVSVASEPNVGSTFTVKLGRRGESRMPEHDASGNSSLAP